MKIHRIEWQPHERHSAKVVNLDLDFVVMIFEPEFSYRSVTEGFQFYSGFKIILDTVNSELSFSAYEPTVMQSLEKMELMNVMGQTPKCHQHLMKVYQEVLDAWKSPYNRQR